MRTRTKRARLTHRNISDHSAVAAWMQLRDVSVRLIRRSLLGHRQQRSGPTQRACNACIPGRQISFNAQQRHPSPRRNANEGALEKEDSPSRPSRVNRDATPYPSCGSQTCSTTVSKTQLSAGATSADSDQQLRRMTRSRWHARTHRAGQIHEPCRRGGERLEAGGRRDLQIARVVHVVSDQRRGRVARARSAAAAATGCAGADAERAAGLADDGWLGPGAGPGSSDGRPGGGQSCNINGRDGMNDRGKQRAARAPNPPWLLSRSGSRQVMLARGTAPTHSRRPPRDAHVSLWDET
jgi:hypothetical protein